MARSIEFRIQEGEIAGFSADVVALKYAQQFYGADHDVMLALRLAQIGKEQLACAAGEHRLVESQGALGAPRALFVGVERLASFGYRQIRAFAVRALEILAVEAPETRHLAMTLHGPARGMDEVECCQSQLAGYLEAIREGRVPAALERITIVEQNARRVERLRRALGESFAQVPYAAPLAEHWGYRIPRQDEQGAAPSAPQGPVETAGARSEAKPHVFVAMPFRPEFEDVFYYGIQGPIRACGYLCERIDQSFFSGDILDEIKRKIQTAALVVADMSSANANVYLEVGYAWGLGRPTILLVNDVQSLCFDVRGQRCLVYASIRQLESLLSKELAEFQQRGLIRS